MVCKSTFLDKKHVICTSFSGIFMKLSTTYKQILAISTPIMLGSAAQNVIVLTDGILLGRVGEVELGAIGFVGVFYLIIAAIGFGFSKGGQLMIARRTGEDKPEEVSKIFYSMLFFELALAVVMFLFMKFGCPYFFALFVDSELIYEKSLEYLDYRAYGVFFSYLGVAIIALYTGIARTTFIIIDTIILGAINIVLNYGLIFGDFGLPEMGIAGAGLASTIAEIVAFIVFVIYMFFDKEIRIFRLDKWPKIDFDIIKQQFRLSTPVVAQAIVGLGSAFVFFSIVENLGERELAITNLIRMVYLCFSIPAWGLCSGIHTIVSNFIGQGKRIAVIPIIKKTAWLSFILMLVIILPSVLIPEYILAIGTDDMSLVYGAIPTLYVLMIILAFFSVASVYFNGLVGTGATFLGLKIQAFWVVIYIGSIYLAVEVIEGGLEMAWGTEIIYWIGIWAFSWWYLRSKRWYNAEV